MKMLVGSLKQTYFKNISKIVVLKQDGVNKDQLLNGEFSLLDENKTIVYSNLITDERGEIIIKNLTPGKYYLKEDKAPDGYVLYDKLIPVELDLNEIVNVTVNNFKKDTVEILDIEESIVVSQKESEISLGKAESNTIIQNHNNSIKLENTNSNEIVNNTNNNIEIENSNINKLVNNSNNNINIENTNTNIVKLPKTGM